VAASWLEHSPELGGALVGEDGGWAEGEGCRLPAASAAEASVADGVDASVDAVEATGAHAPRHAVPGEPARQQLRNVDHSVLPPGNSGN
jgi:hypothetical protein